MARVGPVAAGLTTTEEDPSQMAEPAPPPFEIELHLGGGVVVPFKLWEEGLRQARDPQVRAQAEQGGRDAARMAGVLVAENAVTKNLEQPLLVENGDELWVIPVRTVQAVRFRDPTIKGERQPFGFSADRLGAADDTSK
jgi:hypothetical protein